MSQLYSLPQGTCLKEDEVKACYQRAGLVADPYTVVSHGPIINTEVVQFEAVYKDLQMLSELQRKLLRTRQVIESNIEITKGCRKRYMRYASLERFKFETPVFSALENQDQEFMGHGRRVQEMLDRLHSTVDLLKSVLSSRHDETIRVQFGMNAQLSKLQARLIENIFKVQEQTYKVQKLATSFQEQATASQKQTAMDSKLLKSLTMLATLYLPLNLVVGFFSSEFVQVRVSGPIPHGYQLGLIRQTWLLIAISGPLLFLTVLPIWAFNRWKSQKNQDPI